MYQTQTWQWPAVTTESGQQSTTQTPATPAMNTNTMSGSWPASSYVPYGTGTSSQQWPWGSQGQYYQAGVFPGTWPSTTQQPAAGANPAVDAQATTEPSASEADKLNQLRVQAQQWQQQQQAMGWAYQAYTPPAAGTTVTPAQWSQAGWPVGQWPQQWPQSTWPQTVTPAAPPKPPEPPGPEPCGSATNTSSTTDQTAEEEEFDKQFKDWEKQFETWKEQNADHPDKEAFAGYEKQWQEWRDQLLQKKEEMKKAKLAATETKSSSDSTNAGTTTNSGDISVPKSGIPGLDINAPVATTTSMSDVSQTMMYQNQVPSFYPSAAMQPNFMMPPPPSGYPQPLQGMQQTPTQMQHGMVVPNPMQSHMIPHQPPLPQGIALGMQQPPPPQGMVPQQSPLSQGMPPSGLQQHQPSHDLHGRPMPQAQLDSMHGRPQGDMPHQMPPEQYHIPMNKAANKNTPLNMDHQLNRKTLLPLPSPGQGFNNRPRMQQQMENSQDDFQDDFGMDFNNRDPCPVGIEEEPFCDEWEFEQNRGRGMDIGMRGQPRGRGRGKGKQQGRGWSDSPELREPMLKSRSANFERLGSLPVGKHDTNQFQGRFGNKKKNLDDDMFFDDNARFPSAKFPPDNDPLSTNFPPDQDCENKNLGLDSMSRSQDFRMKHSLDEKFDGDGFNCDEFNSFEDERNRMQHSRYIDDQDTNFGQEGRNFGRGRGAKQFGGMGRGLKQFGDIGRGRKPFRGNERNMDRFGGIEENEFASSPNVDDFGIGKQEEHFGSSRSRQFGSRGNSRPFSEGRSSRQFGGISRGLRQDVRMGGGPMLFDDNDGGQNQFHHIENDFRNPDREEFGFGDGYEDDFRNMQGSRPFSDIRGGKQFGGMSQRAKFGDFGQGADEFSGVRGGSHQFGGMRGGKKQLGSVRGGKGQLGGIRGSENQFDDREETKDSNFHPDDEINSQDIHGFDIPPCDNEFNIQGSKVFDDGGFSGNSEGIGQSANLLGLGHGSKDIGMGRAANDFNGDHRENKFGTEQGGFGRGRGGKKIGTSQGSMDIEMSQGEKDIGLGREGKNVGIGRGGKDVGRGGKDIGTGRGGKDIGMGRGGKDIGICHGAGEVATRPGANEIGQVAEEVPLDCETRGSEMKPEGVEQNTEFEMDRHVQEMGVGRGVKELNPIQGKKELSDHRQKRFNDFPQPEFPDDRFPMEHDFRHRYLPFDEPYLPEFEDRFHYEEMMMRRMEEEHFYGRDGYPPEEFGRMMQDHYHPHPFYGGLDMEPYFPPEFEECAPLRSSQLMMTLTFNSIDYDHQPAASVVGNEFTEKYDAFGQDFSCNLIKFRDGAHSGLIPPPPAPIIFSQVDVKSIDYSHGDKPMVTSTVEGKKDTEDNNKAEFSKKAVFDHAHRREVSPTDDKKLENGSRRSESLRDRLRGNHEKYNDHDKDRRDSDRDRNHDDDRNRDRDRNRDDDRNRDRNRDDGRNQERDRNRDRSEKDSGHDRDRNRDRFRDKDTKREWERDRDRPRNREDKDEEERNKRPRWENSKESDRNSLREQHPEQLTQRKVNVENIGNRKKEPPIDPVIAFPPVVKEVFKSDVSSDSANINDLLYLPGRCSRPKQLVIVLRGLPGSGKTYVAKLIKDKEVENGGSAPRILSLDDYFMTEKEVTEIDEETGKKVKKKEFEYEYEECMEEAYRTSLFKSFKKTIDDRFFPFIIVDAVHEEIKHIEQFWSYAKQRGFQVYIAEMDRDPAMCHKRNIHNRTLEEITCIDKKWEFRPKHYLILDIRSLLQDVAIADVEMEDSITTDETSEEKKDEDDENDSDSVHMPSRWEKLDTEDKLAQLDGLRVAKKKHSTMEDYLQLPDDYEERKCEPGKKRVRWADLEERKEQDRLRAIGFVVGQTDWAKFTDPSHADKALTKTKYF